ncbi:metal-dependent hydrolase [Pelagibius sp. Alg239-R121]|uniref:metal-dependent hydrolase n=1 Tax=Pelagibius sp. Alg239-R121 TaxID=2993448 RepID=UPI0024A76BB6|nr:metal-dependent hydrolase [Pelagibius sp. Alg239-R121]
MDSVTQFVLGSGVGLAVLGRKIGPRKAAITGGLLGTVPDLDVLYPFDDPIDSFILHRGATHSLILQALVTPLFGEGLIRLFKGLRDQRILTYLAIYLCFATHALIDAATIYGTKLFWPVWKEPLGTGSIFIIDPLYTLPLLVITIWALCVGSWSARLRRAVTFSLAISTAYMAWGLIAQQIALSKASDVLARQDIVPERIIATAAPFNSIFWKATAIDGDRYYNLYIPLLGDTDSITAYAHPRGARSIGCLDDASSLQKLAEFSKGFYRIDREDGRVVVSDLRMGLTPEYVFRFSIAEETANGLKAIFPQRRPSNRATEEDIDWLIANLSGDYVLRPAETDMALLQNGKWHFASAAAQATSC